MNLVVARRLLTRCAPPTAQGGQASNIRRRRRRSAGEASMRAPVGADDVAARPLSSPSVLHAHGVLALSLRLLASVLVRGIGGIVEEGEEGRAERARRKHAEFTLRQERGSDRREKRREGEEGRRSVDAKIRQPEERLGGALLRGRDRAGGRRAVHEGPSFYTPRCGAACGEPPSAWKAGRRPPEPAPLGKLAKTGGVLQLHRHDAR